ncbi:DUF6705 family protein [Chryseobacterium lathyri]|jgi:hypothetical protein|uniref:DUF6705 domain-containing protein n=1 Tax=Chryseobacterium lathyri TaxID=395933 RepID=A0A511YC94_9FLAO|nr:DUF6705 family protein [Chryseobacterium lathyri]GEN72820.1 hypothetical protein CLA01_28920 [Chryseobacterium lathyri]
MKNLGICLGILAVLSCKAQQYPLNTDYDAVPSNSYVKDLNNDYDPYIGTWKTSLGNKEVYLNITKQQNREIKLVSKTYFSDVLLIKYKVVINGQIVETTENDSLDKVKIISDGLDLDNSVIFTTLGGKCMVGWGTILLKSIDSTHLKWNYLPDSMVITNKNCSDYPAGGIKINLPYEPADIVFTKQ